MKYLATFVICLVPLVAGAQERVPQSRSEITLSFAPLVRETAPAVVNIYAKVVAQTRARTPFMTIRFLSGFSKVSVSHNQGCRTH